MNPGQASQHRGGFRASGTAAGHSQDLSKSWGRGTAIKQEAPPTWGSERRPSPAQVVIQTLTRPRTASGPAPPFPHLGEDPPDKAQRHPHSTRQGLPLANPRPSQPGGGRMGDRDVETQTLAAEREPGWHSPAPRAPGTAGRGLTHSLTVGYQCPPRAKHVARGQRG